jgi:hypothetical protein
MRAASKALCAPLPRVLGEVPARLSRPPPLPRRPRLHHSARRRRAQASTASRRRAPARASARSPPGARSSPARCGRTPPPHRPCGPRRAAATSRPREVLYVAAEDHPAPARLESSRAQPLGQFHWPSARGHRHVEGDPGADRGQRFVDVRLCRGPFNAEADDTVQHRRVGSLRRPPRGCRRATDAGLSCQITGFTSTIGVPSTASRSVTRSRIPSTATTSTSCRPIGRMSGC